MPENIPIDLDELDWKFARLQRGAEALYRGLASLDDSSFRSYLYAEDTGSAYCSHLYDRLLQIHTDYWKFRLALLWDLFPLRHTYALDYCRSKLEEATRAIEKLQHERPQGIGSWASKDPPPGVLALLSPVKEVSTEAFAEGVSVLAQHVASYCSWDNGLDEWGTLMAFYQDLDAVMVPKSIDQSNSYYTKAKRKR